MCSSYRSNQNPQTVKLSTPSSVHQLAPTSLRARYVSVLTPMRPNRPHIPSTIQFSKSKDTTHQTAPTSGPSATVYPVIPSAASAAYLRFPDPHRSVSVAPHVVSSSVSRYLGPQQKTRKRKKQRLSYYFRKSGFIHNFRSLAQFSSFLKRAPSKSIAWQNQPAGESDGKAGHIEAD